MQRRSRSWTGEAGEENACRNLDWNQVEESVILNTPVGSFTQFIPQKLKPICSSPKKLFGPSTFHSQTPVTDCLSYPLFCHVIESASSSCSSSDYIEKENHLTYGVPRPRGDRGWNLRSKTCNTASIQPSKTKIHSNASSPAIDIQHTFSIASSSTHSSAFCVLISTAVDWVLSSLGTRACFCKEVAWKGLVTNQTVNWRIGAVDRGCGWRWPGMKVKWWMRNTKWFCMSVM